MKKRRKRVLHLITSTDIGGAENMLLKTLPGIQDSLENIVCCLLSKGEIGRRLEEKGIKVIYLNGRIFDLYQVLRDIKPDILVTYLIHADLLGRVFGRLTGVKIIVCSVRALLRDINYIPLTILERLTSFMVDKYLFNSSAVAQYYHNVYKLPENKIVTISNGVAVEEFKKERSHRIRMEIQIPEQSIVVGYIGRFRKQKSLDTLVHAASILGSNRNNLSVYFLLVGGGDQLKNLSLLIQKLKLQGKVLLLPLTENVPELLSSFDIFVLPSFFEGMSNSLLEAMAAGLPVIVTNIPENTQLIKPGYNGETVGVRNPGEIASAILRLAENPYIMRKYGQRNRKIIKKGYDIRRVKTQMKEFLCSVTH